MPNWCENYVKVEGGKSFLKQLEKAIRAGRLYEFFRYEDDERIDQNYIDVFIQNDESLHFSFNSAWIAPTLFYSSMYDHNKVESLKALYYEPSMDYAGCWFNGVMTHIELSEYDRDFFLHDSLGQEIQEHFNHLAFLDENEEEEEACS